MTDESLYAKRRKAFEKDKELNAARQQYYVAVANGTPERIAWPAFREAINKAIDRVYGGTYARPD